MQNLVHNYVRTACSKINYNTILNENESCMLNYICEVVENRVISSILERQKKIPNLIIEDNRVRFGGDLTPGCKICLKNGFTPIRSTWKCNLNCNFCYNYNQKKEILSPLHYSINNRLLTEDDIIRILEKRKDIKGIAWVAGEPFTDFNKIPNLSKRLNNLGIYQHINTNGTLLTEKMMRILQDCGLNEIRFNLAATNCSDKVIETMKVARKYFNYLCIEIPMFQEIFNSFILKKQKILDTGVDHINLDELHLRNENFVNFQNEELYIYNFGYISPISSRQLVYDFLEIASNEKWNVVINDCSNEQKFYRGIRNDFQINEIIYIKEMNLPIEFFFNNISKLNEEELKTIIDIMN